MKPEVVQGALNPRPRRSALFVSNLVRSQARVARSRVGSEEYWLLDRVVTELSCHEPGSI